MHICINSCYLFGYISTILPLLYSSVILCNLSIYYVIVFIHHITFEIVAQCSRKVQKDVIFFNVNSFLTHISCFGL